MMVFEFEYGRVAILLFCILQTWNLCLAADKEDPECNYIRSTRPSSHFIKSEAKVILQNGSSIQIPFCRVRDGRRCFPEGLEAFHFEAHLTKALGGTVPPPAPVTTKIPVDMLKNYELRLKSFSCKSGYCSRKTSGICNGSMGTESGEIDLKKLEEDIANNPDVKKDGQSLFQFLRDICYYVRQTRFAVEGDKDFYPGVADIIWMKGGQKETIEICDISSHHECFPRDEIEEDHLLEYLLFMQKNKTSLKMMESDKPKKGPQITVHDGLYYFYRIETVFKVLNWSCQSGYCSANRRCEPNPAKTDKAPLEFYEYEADIDRLKPKTQSAATRLHRTNLNIWVTFLLIIGIWFKSTISHPYSSIQRRINHLMIDK